MKLAACFSTGLKDRCAEVVEKMACAQRLWGHQEQQVFPLSAGALACVTRDNGASAIPRVHRSNQGNLLLISGTPLDLQGTLARRLEAAVAGGLREAGAALTQLEGVFAALFWDNQAGKLLIVTDIVGMQPLYMAQSQGRLLLASELKAMPASGLVPVEMSLAGWGSFISFGHMMVDATQLAGVKRVPPASVLVYDPANGTLESSTHWRWPAPRRELTLDTVDTGGLVDSFRQEVKAYASYEPNASLLLSGGFDSRFILCTLREAGLSPDALALMHQDELLGADGRLAVKVARQLNDGRCRLVRPPRSFYNSPDYLRFLVMNEVNMPSLGLFIAQVANYIQPAMRAVWEGVFLGATMVTSMKELHGFDDYLDRACRPRQGPSWQAAFRVFSPATAEGMYQCFTDMLAREKGLYADDAFGVTEFFVRNRTRNRTSFSPFRVYANNVMPLTPGCSRAYWQQVAAIPHKLKARGQLYLKMLSEHFPQAVRLPFCSSSMLLSNRPLTPGVRAYLAACAAAQGWRRVTRKMARLRGAAPKPYWAHDDLVRRIVSTVNADHPNLNAQVVREIQADPSHRPPAELNMLFYWETWRRVMDGRLTMANAEGAANG